MQQYRQSIYNPFQTQILQIIIYALLNYRSFNYYWMYKVQPSILATVDKTMKAYFVLLKIRSYQTELFHCYYAKWI